MTGPDMDGHDAKPVAITHYSDVLCVWAYIAHVRMGELETSFPHQVVIDCRFLQVFGDVAGKLAAQWAHRGGVEAYAAHVRQVAARFPHVEVRPGVWTTNTPTSSLPAHLVLCGLKAMQRADPDSVAADQLSSLLVALRHAFFVELRDISSQPQLLDIAAGAGVDTRRLQKVLDSGAAHAALTADLTAASQDGVRSSPTMIFNEGRQTLAGNVGYRVIEANVRELLRQPEDQQSWC